MEPPKNLEEGGNQRVVFSYHPQSDEMEDDIEMTEFHHNKLKGSAAKKRTTGKRRKYQGVS